MLRTVVSRALASRAPAAARAGGNTAWRHTRLMSTEEEPATLAAGAEGEEGEFAPSDEIKFESSEPRYMTTLTFSEAGLQAMIKKDIDREKVRPQTREFRGIRRSRLAIPEPRSVYAKFHVVRQQTPETHVAPVRLPTQSAAKIIGLLGGRLQSYHVTTTGDANAVVTYTFPKNHNVQTLLYTPHGVGFVLEAAHGEAHDVGGCRHVPEAVPGDLRQRRGELQPVPRGAQG